MGSVTIQQAIINEYIYISTHTLRGERDIQRYDKRTARHTFQLTRSVGSVTTSISEYKTTCKISTHTLRGERDGEHKNNIIEAAFQLTRSVGSVTNDKLKPAYQKTNFNSHAPWGA